MEGEAAIPLLRSSTAGDTSSLQTTGNIIVSVVGTGVLGLPFAFQIAGWLAGSIVVIIAGLSTCCCMLKLVECRNNLSAEEESSAKITYGDLGYKSLGRTGRIVTELLILIAQCGGSVAYLVFISQSLSSIFGPRRFTYILLLVPIEILLSWIRSLSALAPFSILADVCNAIAVVVVLREDLKVASTAQREAIAPYPGRLPFAAGMAVFCFEGFGMTLALEASMRQRAAFPKILVLTTAGITAVYVLFGVLGYLAYGDRTEDIVTLNLPANWSATAVQIGLCLGLVFTLPTMMHPIHEIVEGKLKATRCFQNRGGRLGICAVRGVVFVGLAAMAAWVPSFGVFASLVGSTVCAIISFVLPSAFHLRLVGRRLPPRRKAVDYLFLLGGLALALYGAYNAIFGIPRGPSGQDV